MRKIFCLLVQKHFMLSELVITSSKLTIETLEQGVTIKTPQQRTYFTPCSSVSLVNFEQVNVGWDRTNER